LNDGDAIPIIIGELTFQMYLFEYFNYEGSGMTIVGL
jgi:hypothetical protein